ncbi:hypothetical protein BOTNAR_0015g00300 [Botryotinia narcissicola]|uniref:Uncharacterized protein n=1 Tax=Botryotinia narcissicola TaxID=278944 RepID=A0A4Z1J7D4_9HELO|nr:hypothetical protein BOTNAR_0015g00300 [Botryotinia narcissicola]
MTDNIALKSSNVFPEVPDTGFLTMLMKPFTTLILSLSVEDSILEIPGTDRETALNVKLAYVRRILLIYRGSSLKALSDSGYLIKSHLALEPPSGVFTPLDMGYGTIVGRSSAALITLGSKSTAALRYTISHTAYNVDLSSIKNLFCLDFFSNILRRMNIGLHL